jgi:prepilin-type N-terminal cleavage/methylation domain-containing protein
MTTRAARRGFTLFELIVVMTLLLLLAAVILPSVGAFRGDSRQRAGADMIRGELAIARSRAMDEGRPYRVALSQDGKRIRRAPDVLEFAQMPAAERADGSALAVDYPFEHVTAEVLTEQDMVLEATDGWVTIATVQPDGTCREDQVLVVITEPDNGSLRVRVRGLTGSSRVVPNTGTGANAGGTNGNGGAK